jgi:hypothetical protein
VIPPAELVRGSVVGAAAYPVFRSLIFATETWHSRNTDRINEVVHDRPRLGAFLGLTTNGHGKREFLCDDPANLREPRPTSVLVLTRKSAKSV